MNLIELKKRIEELKLILLIPKVFINKYFGDLINQLYVNSTRFELETLKEHSKLRIESRVKKISEILNWKQKIFNELKKTEEGLLSRITPEFKLDDDLTIKIQNIIEIFEDEQNLFSIEECNDFEDKVYKYSLQMKEQLLGNQCFIVLSEATIQNIKQIKMKQSYLWRNILPVIQIREGFIGQRGIQILGYIYIIFY